jgi:hypothetical protein
MLRRLILVTAGLLVLAGCNSNSTTVFIPPAQALYVSPSGSTVNIYLLPFSMGASASPALSGYGTAVDTATDAVGHVFELDNGPVPPIIYQYSRPVASFGSSTAVIGVTGKFSCGYIALDAMGNIWISCFSEGVVKMAGPFNTTGSYSGSITASLGGASHSQQIAFDAAGDLFVADSTLNLILIYQAPVLDGHTPSGSLTIPAPRGVAVDAAGHVYADSQSDNSLRRWNSPSLSTSNQAASVIDPSSSTGLSIPYGMSFDSSGNLYVGTCASNGVALFTSAALATFSSSTAPAFINTTTGCAFSARVGLK